MISSLTLKFTEHEDLVFPSHGITIFVGPNNSGKSLVLKEVERSFNEHPFPNNMMMLKDFELNWPNKSKIEAMLDKLSKQGTKNEGQKTISKINPNGGRETARINIKSVLDIGEAKTDKNWFASQFLKFGLLRLDGWLIPKS